MNLETKKFNRKWLSTFHLPGAHDSQTADAQQKKSSWPVHPAQTGSLNCARLHNRATETICGKSPGLRKSAADARGVSLYTSRQRVLHTARKTLYMH